MRRLAAAAVLGLAALSAGAQEPVAPREAFRLRLANRPGASIEASPDGGATWRAIGKVTRAANASTVTTRVLTVAPASAVAGVTPHQLLIRVPADREIRALRIAAAGQPADPASIATDIPIRGALFRSLAPAIGSRVLLTRAGKEGPLPLNYAPLREDVLTVLAPPPPPGEPPATVTVENKLGGEVALAITGGVVQPIARVRQPLAGIGRYVGTERAGSGCVVSWSPTAVLVATSGQSRRLDAAGKATEERGGFVIQPAEPALKGASNPPSILLLEALPVGREKPYISPFFALPIPLTSCDPLDMRPTHVDVRIDDGDWEPLPDLRGTIAPADLPRALEAALGAGRTVKNGITALRFVYGMVTEPEVRRRITLAATSPAGAPQRGTVTITANVSGEGVEMVSFFLDGHLTTLTNQPPFRWQWDTTNAKNGEHLIEIRGLNAQNAVVTTVSKRVMVDN